MTLNNHVVVLTARIVFDATGRFEKLSVPGGQVMHNFPAKVNTHE
jgi:hypothetical protein